MVSEFLWFLNFGCLNFGVFEFWAISFLVISFSGVLERNSMNWSGEMRSENMTGTPSKDSAHGEAELSQAETFPDKKWDPRFQGCEFHSLF